MEMKYFALLIAVCVCVVAGEKYTPSFDCAVTVDTVLETDLGQGTFVINLMHAKDVIVGSVVDGPQIYIMREDMMEDENVPLIMANEESPARKCTDVKYSKDMARQAVMQYAGFLPLPFEYAGSEDDTFHEIECTKYCKEGDVECIWVKKDCKKNCVVGYARDTQGSVTTFYYKKYEKLNDMSVFALNEDDFPGCTGKAAYTTPENMCSGDDDASSMVKAAAMVVLATLLVALL